MGYYQTFIEKQERIKQELKNAELEKVREKRRERYQKYKNREYYTRNKERQKENAKKYYYKNREYVLERQKTRKYQNSQYYKEWYEKNRIQLLTKRNGGKKPDLDRTVSSEKKHNTVSSEKKHNVYNNTKRLQDVANPFLLFG